MTHTILSMEFFQTILQTIVEWVRDLLLAVSGRYAEEFIVKRSKRRRRRRKKTRNIENSR